LKNDSRQARTCRLQRVDRGLNYTQQKSLWCRCSAVDSSSIQLLFSSQNHDIPYKTHIALCVANLIFSEEFGDCCMAGLSDVQTQSRARCFWPVPPELRLSKQSLPLPDQTSLSRTSRTSGRISSFCHCVQGWFHTVKALRPDSCSPVLRNNLPVSLLNESLHDRKRR
jgi:hypothetical protein